MFARADGSLCEWNQMSSDGLSVTEQSIRGLIMLARRLSMIRVSNGRSFAMAGTLTALLLAWLWPLAGMAHELFAAHMLQHMLVMNVAALLIAAAFSQKGRGSLSSRVVPRGIGKLPVANLPVVTTMQLVALWVWHMPAVLTAAHHSPILMGLMQVSLFGAALLFWRAVLARDRRSAWPAIFALLATAKVYCLLGAILVFSRRPLYPAFGNPEGWGFSALEDQQLAGLSMISACAVTYIAVAIVLFALWLGTMDTPRGGQPRWTRGSGAALISE
jgi:putative membrane protein